MRLPAGAMLLVLGLVSVVVVVGCGDEPRAAAPSTVLTVPSQPTSTATTSSSITTSSAVPSTVEPTTIAPATTATAPSVPDPPDTTSAGIAGSAESATSAGVVVVIDPGHNGGNGSASAEINRQVEAGGFRKACDTTGTATNGGYSESAFNWDVSNRLAGLLRAAGVQVVMTRDSDSGVGPCIDRRAGIGNLVSADVAVSVHADGSGAGNRGFHILVPGSLPGFTDDIAEPSRQYARILREELPAAGMPPSNYVGSDGIMVRTDLGGLNLSDVPKVFVESGNMRDPTDAALLTSPEFRQRWAERIAAATLRFLSGRRP